jgi:hypothetical protein
MMFVGQKWWASESQSNGGILGVRPTKIKLTSGISNASVPEISKNLYSFDNRSFTN